MAKAFFAENAIKQGTLYLCRKNRAGTVLKSYRRRYFSLYMSRHMLAYYGDSEMDQVLGWINLRYAEVAYDSDRNMLFVDEEDKVFVFQQEERTDPLLDWYNSIQAVVQRICLPKFYGALVSDIKGGYVLSVAVHCFRKDEIEQQMQYGVLCRVAFLSKMNNRKAQTEWIVYVGFDEFKALDGLLRQSLGWQMDKVEFPRDRKRDALRGGSHNKTIMDKKMESLNDYLQHVVAIPNVTEFHKHHGNSDLKEFLKFNTCFGQDAPRISHEPVMAESQVASPHHFDDSFMKDAPKVTSPLQEQVKGRKSRVRRTMQKSPKKGGYSWSRENVSSSTKSSIELVRGSEATKLNAAIMKAVSDEKQGDANEVLAFKNTTKSYGAGDMNTEDYFEFLRSKFTDTFTTWLINDLVHLIPNEQQREELHEISMRKMEEIQNDTNENEEAADDSLLFPIDEYDIQVVTSPERGQALHQNILDTVYDAFHGDTEKVEDFQDQSKCFGRGEITAAEFVAFLLGGIGYAAAKSLLLSMLRLLPDKEKRNELIAALKLADQRQQRKKARSLQFSNSSNSVGHHTTRMHSKSTTGIPAIARPTRESSKSERSLLNATSHDLGLEMLRIHETPDSKSRPNSAKLSQDNSQTDKDDDEENPVLARLRKQGAVNFLGP